MAEFDLRRERLALKVEENSAIIIHSGVSKIASEDEFYLFTCNNDFYYLTGITQENSTLIIIKALGTVRTFLFVEPYSELKEKWTGKRLTINEASAISGIHDVFDNTLLNSKLSAILDKNSLTYGAVNTLYIDNIPELKIEEGKYAEDFASSMNEQYPNLMIKNIHPEVVKLRLIKSNLEIEAMKEAINKTNHGINEMLQVMKNGMFEYQLAGTFFNYGYMQNKTKLAFNSIVASGKNATCLHYPSQNDMIKSGDLILFDLGYKHEGYSADISRTYPINGKFNELQKNIYEAVLLCNKAVIEHAREGLTIKDLQEFTINFYLNELPKRGLMPFIEDKEVAKKELFKVYYHGVSHYLGLDTHDVCISREEPLEAGNVITVEPGLYFAEYGIGVRIEDDVLITKEGNEVLTRGVKKEINQIETILKGKM